MAGATAVSVAVKSTLWPTSDGFTEETSASAEAALVTCYWMAYLLSVEQSTMQAQLLFARALEDPGSARSRRPAGQP